MTPGSEALRSPPAAGRPSTLPGMPGLAAVRSRGAARAAEALLPGSGWTVHRALVDDDLTERAVRRLNLEILRCGITAEQIEEWKYGTFWPSLRAEPEFLAVRDALEQVLRPVADEQWAPPQLLLRFPDEADEWPLTPHVDEVPDSARPLEYGAVAGIALSRSAATDGCLAVWPGSHRGEGSDPELVELERGDVVVMHPRLGHSSTLNRGGTIRYAIYFRLLTPPAAVRDRPDGARR
jgi:hypothetical protein